jgi:hypothetical protein
MGGRRLAELAGRCKLGCRLKDPRHDHGQRQLCQPLWRASQQLIELKLPRHAQDGGHMAVGQRALDLSLPLPQAANLAFQQPAQRLNLGVRPVCEVGERARFDFAAVAIAFAQQHGRWRRAVWNPGHVHAIGMP